MLLGSSREFVGFDASINRRDPRADDPARPRVHPRPRASLRDPHLGGLPPGDARQPAAHRPVGEDARASYVAAGHEGLGITTALATARLVADAILGRSEPDRSRALLADAILSRRRPRMTDASSRLSTVAALENEGRPVLRRSVSGEPRGRPVRDGDLLRVPRDARWRPAPARLHGDGRGAGGAPAPVSQRSRRSSATSRSSARGRRASRRPAARRRRERGPSCSTRTRRRAGRSTGISRGQPAPRRARPWLERLDALRAPIAALAERPSSTRCTATDGVPACFAETAEGAVVAVRARALVLATGARELFLPFPGWTLPGVMGAGGAQAPGEDGRRLSRAPAVVAGSGPLLLPVAASLAGGGRRSGARRRAGRVRRRSRGSARRSAPIAAEARSRPRATAAASSARPYRTGTWIAEAQGRRARRSRSSSPTAGTASGSTAIWRPSATASSRTRSSRGSLGCADPPRRRRRRRGAGDERRPASSPRASPAASPALDVAIAEGEIAGLGRGRPLRRRGSDAAPALAVRGARPAPRRRHGSRLPPARRSSPPPSRADTIVCRCEDVRLAPLAACGGRARGQARDARRHGPLPGPRLRPGARVPLRLGFGYGTPARQTGRARQSRGDGGARHEMAGSLSGDHDAVPRGPLARPRLPGAPARGDARGRLPRDSCRSARSASRRR